MNLKELREIISGTELTPFIKEDNFEINYAFCGDLMSDALMVLRTAPIENCEQGVLITGNSTVQGIRTAEMLDLPIVIITRGKMPTQQVIDQAYQSNVIIITTNDVAFTVSGKLYQHGIVGLSNVNANLH